MERKSNTLTLILIVSVSMTMLTIVLYVGIARAGYSLDHNSVARGKRDHLIHPHSPSITAPDVAIANETTTTEEPDSPEVPSSAALQLKGLTKETLLDKKEEIDVAKRLKEWDDFYRVCKALKIAPQEYQRLIIERVADGLKLKEEDSATMVLLLKEEQEAVTSAAHQKYGSGQSLRDWAGGSGGESKQFFADLRVMRELVRKTYDASFLNTFSRAQLDVINEHLRNDAVWVVSEFQGSSLEVRIGGVGK